MCTRRRNTEGDLSCEHEGGTQREIRVVHIREELKGRFELCTGWRNTDGDLSWVHEGGTQREI